MIVSARAGVPALSMLKNALHNIFLLLWALNPGARPLPVEVRKLNSLKVGEVLIPSTTHSVRNVKTSVSGDWLIVILCEGADFMICASFPSVFNAAFSGVSPSEEGN